MATAPLAPIRIGRAVALSAATLLVHYFVLFYRNTRDLQATRTQAVPAWRWLFWIGVVPPLWPVHVILCVLNWQALAELRAARGAPGKPTKGIAAIVWIVVPPVGQVLWARHYNASIQAVSRPVAAQVRRIR